MIFQEKLQKIIECNNRRDQYKKGRKIFQQLATSNKKVIE